MNEHKSITPVYFINHVENETLFDKIKTAITDKNSTQETVVFINLSDRICGHAHMCGVSSFFVQLYRQHKLGSNERQSVLSCGDQLVALQLCMANGNKQTNGEMDINVSEVILANREICNHKLGTGVEPQCDTTIASYRSFLDDNNYLDLTDVYLMVKHGLEIDKDMMSSVKKMTLVFVGHPHTNLQELMLQTLCANRQLSKICVASSLSSDDVAIEVHELDASEVPVMKSDDNIVFSPLPPRSLCEHHVTTVMMAYVELLVNSRSELALARSINTPDRGLDHAAFTAIRHTAGDKHMPMYQLILSHVMRVRLGGRGYAPDPHSALMCHVKGLSVYTDLVHRLQTVIEEITDPLEACRKVVIILRSLLLKATTAALRPSSVTKVADDIIDRARRLVSHPHTAQFFSPAKSIGEGGSLEGRHTLRVLRSLHDLYATSGDHGQTATDTLSDIYTSQRTPLRIPSLLTQFRSPDEVDSPDSKVTTTLAGRMLEKQHDATVKQVVRGKVGGYDWAPANVFIDNHRGDDHMMDSQTTVLPGKTLMEAGRGNKRETEAVGDQENITRPDDDCCVQETTRDTHCVVRPGRGTKRRDLCEVTNHGDLVSKRLKVNAGVAKVMAAEKGGKKTKGKSCRRKLEITQVKGQQSLMRFFR